MTDRVCHACGQRISGRTLVPFGDRAYHPECFVCRRCGQPIGNSPFSIDIDRAYHLECMHVQPDPRCAGCGSLILGPHIVAYSQTWHPEHFSCTRCRKPFTSSNICEQDGNLYCANCHDDLFIPRCAICQGHIRGPYVQNVWGDIYCSTHEQEYTHCSCCKRPICRSLTKDGYIYTYSDGRRVCTVCRESAIDTDKDAWHTYNRVRRYLISLGVVPIHDPITPLELADQRQVNAVSATQTAGDTLGTVMRVSVSRHESHLQCAVRNIYLLYGLPRELFSAVAAHELGHVWLCLNNIEVDIPEIEEGFCELLGYLWLESQGTPTSGGWMKDMLVNSNPVFSNGLQLALNSYRRHSMARIMGQLRSSSMLP